MKKVISLFLIVAVLSIFPACNTSNSESDNTDESSNTSDSASSYTPQVSSQPQTPPPVESSSQSQSLPSTAPESSSVPETPVTHQNNPDNAKGSDGTKYIDTPMEDPFTMLKTLEMGGVTSSSKITSIDISLSTGGTVSITDVDGVQAVWNAMANTQVTQNGALEANPSTGGKTTLTIFFDDATKATIEMSGIIFFNGTNGPFIFVDESSESVFTSIYSEYGGS